MRRKCVKKKHVIHVETSWSFVVMWLLGNALGNQDGGRFFVVCSYYGQISSKNFTEFTFCLNVKSLVRIYIMFFTRNS